MGEEGILSHSQERRKKSRSDWRGVNAGGFKEQGPGPQAGDFAQKTTRVTAKRGGKRNNILPQKEQRDKGNIQKRRRNGLFTI